MRRGWSKSHWGQAGQGDDWKPDQWKRSDWSGPPAQWEYRPGAKAWRGFGRKIFFGMFLFFGFMAIGLWVAFTIISAVFSELWVGLLVTPLVIFLVVMLFVRSGIRTWRPVRNLIGAAGQLADGDYTVRVVPSGSASSRQVVRSFNEMAGRLESADEQRRQLLADLGHELRTPLTVIRGEIEAIADGVYEPDPEHLQILLEEVAVMERLLEDLRTLSMAEAGALALHVESTDLGSLVSDAVDGHRRIADAQAVAVSVQTADLAEVVVDPVRLREVVSNLVVNALRAMPDGGALIVTVGSESGQAVIRVRDSGIGIAPDELDRVFDRFRKGSTSAGSGLGLTITRDLVEAHGGLITISSEVAIGTTVEVRLPLRRG